MEQKETLAQQYAEKEVRRYNAHTGLVEQYGIERAKMCSDFDGYELEEAFCKGWEAAMRELYKMPLDKAIMEIEKEVNKQQDD